MSNSSITLPFVCSISAIKPEERDRHRTLVHQWLDAVQEMRELDNGYAFRLPTDPQLVFATAEFISRERFCCAFFSFDLDVDYKVTWLHLTGPEGIKPFIIEEFGLQQWLSRRTKVQV